MHKFAFFLLGLILFAGLTACGGSDDDDNRIAACSDQIDNDNDGLTDFPNDPGCDSASDNNETDPDALPACADGLDNDNDGDIDFPFDPGCDSASDVDETNPATTPACSDSLDNDNDGKTDFPNDPGCTSSADNDETDPANAPACSDGNDNDGDTLTDFPADPGCQSASDDDETDVPPPATPACSDGLDNDGDGLIDHPADPGCSSADDNNETDPVAANSRTRYAMANACWAIKANGNGNYLVRNSGGYAATAASKANAEPFYLKPSALGNYLLYNRNRELISSNGSALSNVASADATDNAEWTVLGVGDSTEYPAAPQYNVEPTADEVASYMSFVDPNLEFSEFTVNSGVSGSQLAIASGGALTTVAAGSDPDNSSFTFEAVSGCSEYPEAQSNFSGTPFKGTLPDGRVLGHADVHVHISSSEFLGGGQWGHAYHKFGIEHALGDCDAAHGPTGHLDLIGGLFTQDTDGHATDGYPTFTEWPSRGHLTHEAIYWKWLERAWAAGLRVVVNDLVDNETLCELQRNASGDPLRDCNSMNNAGRQAGTMYGMMDYIDAQYGGRGDGFFQIVHDPAAAREVIADGKIAVVLGIEISNLFNCKLTYGPLRMQPPETEDGSGGIENAYGCTTQEGLPNSILTQMERLHGLGVRQIISIHEFDNAMGGNGIFDGSILNLGNRENSGGIPSGDLAALTNLLTPDLSPELVQEFVTNLPTTETPTGEFWTTYDCPVEGGTNGFSGYLWGSAGGSTQTINISPFCIPSGQGGRAGGIIPCYPTDVRQCNARWMTPAGEYTYNKLMEMGFIIDFDHMAVGMKTQLLEMTEAQDIPYPIVSTHGSFGGITVNQAERILRNGGYLYPSNGSSRGFRSDMTETYGLYLVANAGNPEPPLFGFGYGTDTNGLSAQSGPRGSFDPDDAVIYPYTLFKGELFDSLPEFTNVEGVSFDQPRSVDVGGMVRRTWHEDIDGNAHYGMLSGFIEEIRQEGSSDNLRHLFNSAEAYLRTWEQTQASSAAIQANGAPNVPGAPVRRPAPVGAGFDVDLHYR